MTKPVIAIQFPDPADEEALRVFNFIEEVHSFGVDKGIAAMDNIDHYGNGRFVVTVSAARHLGEMNKAILHLLKKHNLQNEAVVSRLDRA